MGVGVVCVVPVSAVRYTHVNIQWVSISLSLYLSLSLNTYIYIYIYAYTYMCVYIYIYIYTHKCYHKVLPPTPSAQSHWIYGASLSAGRALALFSSFCISSLMSLCAFAVCLRRFAFQA